MKGNFKAVIVCLLAIVCLGLLSEKADALSVRLRGMVGAIPLEKADSFSANGMGLDVFVYEGGNMDIFLGAEQDSYSVAANWGESTKIKYSAKGTAFDMGFRFKPTTTWRIKPYFPVELLYFQDISYSDVKMESLTAGVTTTVRSISQPDNKIGGRVGVGTDIGISDRLTLGVEGFVTYFPQVKIKYRDTDNFGSREFEGSGGFSFLSINLGLRYSF